MEPEDPDPPLFGVGSTFVQAQKRTGVNTMNVKSFTFTKLQNYGNIMVVVSIIYAPK